MVEQSIRSTDPPKTDSPKADASVTERRSRLVERVCLAVAAVGLLIAVVLLLWHGRLPFEGLVRKFAQIDKWPGSERLASQAGMVRKYYRLSLAAGFALVGFTALLVWLWGRLNELMQARVWRATWTLASTSVVWFFLFKTTTALPGAPVDMLMSDPGSVPIFGHRLLFVWLAKAFQTVAPTQSSLHCFYASQLIAALLAIYAIGRWSAIHVGESLASLGQVIAAVLISTCLTYRNFYDIGIVFFYSLALLALYRRKCVWFVVLVTVATLNHENALLLIPTAAFLLYDSEPPKVWVSVVGAALVGHVLVRFTLQWLMPFQKQVDWRIWTNMTKPFVLPADMAYSILAIGVWYVLGLMSLPACDHRLRRLVVLFPMLFGVTFLFGQFIEPRQFNAFIPVLVAILLTAVRARLRLESDPAHSE
jgi:hypothetical protein